MGSRKSDKPTVIVTNVPAYVKEKEILRVADTKFIGNLLYCFYNNEWMPKSEAKKLVEGLLKPVRNAYGDPIDSTKIT